MQNLLKNNKFIGFFYLLIASYSGWIVFDCYQAQTLTSSQINSMSVIAIGMGVSGLYYLFK